MKKTVLACAAVMATLIPAAAIAQSDGGPTSSFKGSPSSFQAAPEVLDYVRANPPQSSVDIEVQGGTVAPGVVVPSSIALQRVPDTQYEYAKINDATVIVDSATRQVLYVVE